MRLIEKAWSGGGVLDRIARVVLAPLEGLYRGVVAVRGALYNTGTIPVVRSPIPVVSVGNLTVGGTGKTPVSAWIAEKLVSQGISPFIVMRGYGGDEPMVHSRTNPGVPVIVAVDRSEGIAQAAKSGADVAVLDDAFQHRRAARDVDLVLVSADIWSNRTRMLPAGPFREPMSALRRASAVIITRKTATDDQVMSVRRLVAREATGVPIVVLRLELSELIRETPPSGSMPAGMLRGMKALAVAAIGNPGAFFRQLEAEGALVDSMTYPDHHRFTAGDVAELTARSVGRDLVVCTLKDAVKLGPMWPAGSIPLWYVSLAVRVESGEAAIDALMMRLMMRLRGRIAVN